MAVRINLAASTLTCGEHLHVTAAFGGDPLGRFQLEDVVYPGLGGGQRPRWAVEETASPRRGRVVHVVGRHHLVDQAQRQGFLRVEEAPAENELLSPAGPGRAGQAR